MADGDKQKVVWDDESKKPGASTATATPNQKVQWDQPAASAAPAPTDPLAALRNLDVAQGTDVPTGSDWLHHPFRSIGKSIDIASQSYAAPSKPDETVLQGVGKSLGRTATAIPSMVAHPYDALVGGNLELKRRADEEAAQGKTASSMLHSVAAGIPLVGPAAINIGERIGGTEDDPHLNSIDAIKAHRGDIAGGLTDLGTAVALGKSPAGKGAGEIAERVTSSGPSVGEAASAARRAVNNPVETASNVIDIGKVAAKGAIGDVPGVRGAVKAVRAARAAREAAPHVPSEPIMNPNEPAPASTPNVAAKPTPENVTMSKPDISGLSKEDQEFSKVFPDYPQVREQALWETGNEQGVKPGTPEHAQVTEGWNKPSIAEPERPFGQKQDIADNPLARSTPDNPAWRTKENTSAMEKAQDRQFVHVSGEAINDAIDSDESKTVNEKRDIKTAFKKMGSADIDRAYTKLMGKGSDFSEGAGRNQRQAHFKELLDAGHSPDEILEAGRKQEPPKPAGKR